MGMGMNVGVDVWMAACGYGCGCVGWVDDSIEMFDFNGGNHFGHMDGCDASSGGGCTGGQGMEGGGRGG